MMHGKRKRIFALLLVLALCLGLCACGRKGAAQEETSEAAVPAEQIVEVRITMDNLYQYFEYKEYKSYLTNEDGNVTSAQIAYGLALREGYAAANSPAHKGTMKLTFVADGVVNSGDFTVDFDTLHFSGDLWGTERETITQTLSFWPKGSRTTVWTFGNYSNSYVSYLENFQVTEVSGSIYLVAGE